MFEALLRGIYQRKFNYVASRSGDADWSAAEKCVISQKQDLCLAFAMISPNVNILE